MKLKKIKNQDIYTTNHEIRFRRALEFIEDLIQPSDLILDLGPINPFTKLMKEKGYKVQNTPEKMDLDFDYGIVKSNNYDVVIAFEILEHLVSPFPLLYTIKASKLFASVPLKLWFANAYWNENDPYDRHYHEFETRQFDMFLNKAGWTILKSEKWISNSNKIGIRPLLRKFTYRHYIVYCERNNRYNTKNKNNTGC